MIVGQVVYKSYQTTCWNPEQLRSIEQLDNHVLQSSGNGPTLSWITFHGLKAANYEVVLKRLRYLNWKTWHLPNQPNPLVYAFINMGDNKKTNSHLLSTVELLGKGLVYVSSSNSESLRQRYHLQRTHILDIPRSTFITLSTNERGK